MKMDIRYILWYIGTHNCVQQINSNKNAVNYHLVILIYNDAIALFDKRYCITFKVTMQCFWNVTALFQNVGIVLYK